MEHVTIKIFACAGGAPVSFADAIAVFHRWIQSRNLPELLIDVADYSHVPAGPGVMLIGHQANYSLDNARNRPGFVYSRKVADGAAAGESLQQAYDSALTASQRIEAEPEFQGKLKFNRNELEITLNDRLLYPNTEEGWKSVEPELRAFLEKLYGEGAYCVTRSSDPRERLSILVAADVAHS